MAKKVVIRQATPYKVDKNVPLERKKKVHTRFPFDKMKVGDSFYIPKKDQLQSAAVASVYAAANSYNKTFSTRIKISTRKDDGGLRVWRIEDKPKT